jgi:predicted Na+-dependent transporter
MPIYWSNPPLKLINQLLKLTAISSLVLHHYSLSTHQLSLYFTALSSLLTPLLTPVTYGKRLFVTEVPIDYTSSADQIK